MKMKKTGALILGCVMGLTALCAPALATADAPETGSDLYSLTVSAGAEADIANANVVLDLYYVASATADERYDTYGYEMAEAYGALEIPANVTNEDWRALAQEAAKIALESETPADTVAPAETAAGLDAGLYLVIARGADIEDYVTYLPAEEEDAAEQIATVAQSPEYVYTYLPELVAVPGKAADADGNINTAADYGDWLSDVAVTLKPEQSVRYGELRIDKTVIGFGSESVSFLFQIEGSREVDGKSFSDVVAMTFDAAGSDSIIVENIPMGATVTVTEVYSGAAFTLTSANDQTATITAEEIASVAFENTYNGSANSGSAVVNHFEYMGEELGWDWNGSTNAPQE